MLDDVVLQDKLNILFVDWEKCCNEMKFVSELQVYGEVYIIKFESELVVLQVKKEFDSGSMMMLSREEQELYIKFSEVCKIVK